MLTKAVTVQPNRRGRWIGLHQLLMLVLAAVISAGMACCVCADNEYRISVNAASVKGRVSPLLFGNNTSWLDGEKKFKDCKRPELGMRSDVVTLSWHLGVSILRFPGGMLSDVYHWRHGVGPMKQRRPSLDCLLRPKPSYFGTNEFVAFCREIGCRQMVITANYCTGTPQEAANWVEYCNALVPEDPNPSWRIDSYDGTDKAPRGYFAWLRSQFGDPEPYGIKYWEIGNEVYCAQPIKSLMTPGHSLNARGYGRDVVKYATAMKVVDPTIKVGVVAIDTGPWTDWNEPMLQEAAKYIDFVFPHYYNTLQTLIFEDFCTSSESSRRLHFPATDEYTFSVTAKANIIEEGSTDEERREIGIPAHMELRIDGVTVDTRYVDKVPRRYDFKSRVEQGYHIVSIAFTNDSCFGPGKDRNLHVYRVTRRSKSVREESVWYPADTEQQLIFNDSHVIAGQIRRLRAQLQKHSPDRKIEIAVTEGGLNYHASTNIELTESPADSLRDGLRHKAALWLAGLLNTYVREQVSMYCHWLLFDVGLLAGIRYPARTAEGTALVSPSYYVMRMYSRLGGAEVLDSDVTSPVFTYPTDLPVPPVVNGNDHSRSLPRPENVPYLDAIACRSGDRRTLYIVVSNRRNAPAKTRIRVKDFCVRKTGIARMLSVVKLAHRRKRIIGNVEQALEAHNETRSLWDKLLEPDDVRVTILPIDDAKNDFTYTFPAYSVTLLELREESYGKRG